MSVQSCSPREFLHRIGLEENPALHIASPEWDAAVTAAGGDPFIGENHAPFCDKVIDNLFLTEKLAKAAMSYCFDRYRHHIQALERFSLFPECPPMKVVELGGGAGVVALYLASKWPYTQVTVLDWAEKPLVVGRKMAADADIRNIKYYRAAYSELVYGRLSPEVSEVDLVLVLHSVTLTGDLPPWLKDADDHLDNMAKGLVPLIPSMTEAAEAIDQLLSENGVAIVTETCNLYGIIHFFAAVKYSGLGIDWSRSFVNIDDGHPRDDMFDRYPAYIFVQRDMSLRGANVWDAAHEFFRNSPGPVDASI